MRARVCLCVPATLASWAVLMFRALGRTRKVTAGPRTLPDRGERERDRRESENETIRRKQERREINRMSVCS